MATNKRDIQWLTYGAQRLRDETHGACKWDEAGTFKIFAEELIGTHFATALERVIGHATDPDAKTPGAIKRPFVPQVTSAPTRTPYDPRHVCHDCGKPKHPTSDHPFRSIEYVRSVQHAPAPKALRDAITPTRSWPASPVPGTTHTDASEDATKEQP
jgi:hypothetical protein